MNGQLTLFAKLSLANFRRHRARWLLTVFGVALGLTSFTGVLAMTRSIVAAFERSVTQTAGVAQLQVSNGTAGVDAGLVDLVRAVPDVEAASGNVRYSVALPQAHRRLTVFGLPLGTDGKYREAQFGPEALELPDNLAFLAQADSVAVADALLTERGWHLGDAFDVQGPTGPRTLTVRGVLHPTGALRIFGDDVAVMDSDAAQHAFGKLDQFHWIDVVVRRGASVEVVRAAVVRAVGGRAVVDTPLGRGRRMEAMLGTLRTMLTLSAVVAMLVGVFLIYHTVATAVGHRRAELMTLWALGAPRRRLIAHLLVEVLVVGLAGSLLGIGMGLGLARLATGAFSEVISSMYAPVPRAGVTVSMAELALALGVGLSAVLAGGVVPCVRVYRMAESRASPSPVLLAAAGVLALALGPVLAWGARAPAFWMRVAAVGGCAALVFAGVTLLVPLLVSVVTPALRALLRGAWGVLGAWTWLQVRKRPGHTAVTMGALAAGAAYALGLAILLGSYRHAFGGWMRQSFAADVFVTAGRTLSLLGGPTIDPAFTEELRTVPGVRRVLPWRLVEVELSGRPIIVQAMAEELIERAHPHAKLDHAAGEVVISDTLADRYGIAVGDALTLAAPVAPLTLRVRAVEPDYVIDLGNVKVGWELFSRHFGDQGANALLVDADPAVSIQDLKRRIEEQAGSRRDVSVLSQHELHEMVDQLLDRSFALTHALEMLAAIVTLCAMVNATSTAIVERADELVTLRALGMQKDRLVRLLTVEAGLVGALGSVLGLVAGCELGETLVGTVAPAVAGFRFPVQWPVGAMAALTTLSVASAAGAGFFVARRWTRQGLGLDPDPAAWRRAG